MCPPDGPAPEPICYTNGSRYVLPPGCGEKTLLQFLREQGLTGTKLGCGEGGCGACTVMLTAVEAGKLQYRAVNACLCPLYAVEGMHVVTVEGIGNVRQGLHPVQERLARAHGSQCGFCTPGFVMSMYSLLRIKASVSATPTEADIECHLAGNLCRCTGYRPILDAFRPFTTSGTAAYTEEAIAAAHSEAGVPLPRPRLRTKRVNGTQKICPSTGAPCDCSEAAAVRPGPPREPIFPPELRRRGGLEQAASLYLPGARVTWHRPTSLDELLDTLAQHPDGKIVCGNTEVGIEVKFKHAQYHHLIAATHVPELLTKQVVEGGVEYGASVTFTHLMEFFSEVSAMRPPHQCRSLQAISRQLHWFAGAQIRNVATVGGNIVTGSPISDVNPLLMACGAIFTICQKGAQPRRVAARDFFLGYRRVDLQPGEALKSVFLPFTTPLEFVQEFKQAHRRDDDIAIANAGMRAVMKPAADCAASPSGKDWIFEEAEFSFGGVAAKTVLAPTVSKAIANQPLSQETLAAALAALKTDVHIEPGAPGGQVEYRMALASSFLLKFFFHLAHCLEEEDVGQSFPNDHPWTNPFPERERSAAQPFERPSSRGVQFHASPADDRAIVGQSFSHRAADLQVCGEARYCDDERLPANTLHAALVLSSCAHAHILALDASVAESMPGVAGFFGYEDVPGDPMIGPVKHDEEVFASTTVTCVGQVIGVVVAETQAEADEAARAVKVEYRDLPAVLSAEEAIECRSFYASYDHRIECGHLTAGFEGCERKIVSFFVGGVRTEASHGILEGTLRIGGQEHFYLEPHSCAVVPQENDEFLLLASTQAPTKHQKTVAGVLGIPENRVVAKTKRLGGGFGGKETRSCFVQAAAAVPAYHLRRPVRLVLDRDQDMQASGQRHAFVVKYKVGYTADGRLLALEMDLYSNAGNSEDLSASVMDRALMHSDATFKIPNMLIRGHLCRTNQASNTAFRGFGGPQAMLATGMVLDDVARTLRLPPESVRDRNLYREGQLTHFGQMLDHCRLGSVWTQVCHTADLEARQAAAAEFNAARRYRKRGLAVTATKFGISFTTKFLNQAGALVHLYTDGTVLVSHGGVEMGQGLHTKMCQVAAQALNVPLASVFIADTATDKVPNTSPTAASASSDLYGGAILDACRQLQDRLAPYRTGLGPKSSMKEVAMAAYLDRVDLSAHGFYRTPDITGFGGNRPFNYFCYGAAVTEVEVDTLTGDFHILRSDICMDVGNPLNPAIDIGQVEGGFVQGAGWTTLEELVWGDAQHPWVRPGKLHTSGPGTYKIPTVNDIPLDLRVTLLHDAPNARAVHSSKAVGEPPLHLGASVFFAIKEAIAAARADAGLEGAFPLDSPATPERIRMACPDAVTAAQAGSDFRPSISC